MSETCQAGAMYAGNERAAAFAHAARLTTECGKPFDVALKVENISDGLPHFVFRSYYEVVEGRSRGQKPAPTKSIFSRFFERLGF